MRLPLVLVLILLSLFSCAFAAIESSACYPLNSTNICYNIHKDCDENVYKYAIYYYCSSSSLYIHSAIIAALSILLISLFVGLGITASDFLYPNLNYISNMLGLNQRVAGMTLLALGNSTPDIFSTYSAMSSGSTSLAIGELIGAALLVVTVVIGSMAIVNPLVVNKRDFMRDIICFTGLIIVSLYFIIDGRLTIFECGCMTLLYILYVCVLLILNYTYESQLISDVQNDIETCVDHGVGESLVDAMLDNDCHSISSCDHTGLLTPILSSLKKSNSYSGRISPTSLLSPVMSPMPSCVSRNSRECLPSPTSPNMVRFSVHDVLRVWSINSSNELQNRTNSSSSLYQSKSNVENNFIKIPSFVISDSEDPVEPLPAQFYDASFQSTSSQPPFKPPKPVKSLSTNHIDNYSNANIPKSFTEPLQKAGKNLKIMTANLSDRLEANAPPDNVSNLTGNDISVISSIDSILNGPDEGSSLYIKSDTDNNFNQYRDSIFSNLFAEFENLKNPIKICSFVLALFSLPIMIILTLTIPVPSSFPGIPSKHENGLKYFQIFLIPFVINHVLQLLKVQEVLVVSIPLVVISFYLCSIKSPQAMSSNALTNFVLSVKAIIGFSLSLVWISIFSQKVILVLKNIGLILNISESLLGLTLFAIGNSIGDMISNITLSKLGLSISGFGACFGAPLLYILIGIGCNGGFIILSNRSPDAKSFILFEVNINIIVSAFGLLFILFFYLFYIPYNNWTFNRTIGCIGIGWWCLVTVTNCIIDKYSFGSGN